MPLQSIKKTYEILAGLKRHTTVFMDFNVVENN